MRKLWTMVAVLTIGWEAFIVFAFVDEPWHAYLIPLLLPAIVLGNHVAMKGI
ncbi:putative membrane protein [Rhodococcus phage Mbo2]|uniref:Membrane protein n=1 Tax=Rhodococcus phage Mbo2 TaxID=2936911 RepID=A0A9E7LBN0_9CAUD|nr:putative membrane protein [Rhodococcus phage Mbo2]